MIRQMNQSGMDNTLLLIIDPQFDFINLAGEYAKRHSGINQILAAREKISKLAALHNNTNLLVISSAYKKDQFEKGLLICIPGTIGHSIDLNIDHTFTTISKATYSCFSSEEFLLYLQNKNITRIAIGGFLAEYCVKQTALDGLANGFSITLIKDCIGTGDDVQERRQQLFLQLLEKGAKLVDSDDYV